MTAEVFFYLGAAVVSGAILCTWVGGFVVDKLIDYTVGPVLDDNSGLEAAGRWIGYTERFLIYVFVLAGSPTAIALLVAAKTLMRLDKLDEPESDNDESDGDVRAVSEYTILGTLLSFSWGVFIAYLTDFVVQTWVLS